MLSKKESVDTQLGRHDFLPENPIQISSYLHTSELIIIKAKVEIGHGAVVGIGSVITKNVAPYSVVAGVVADQIRMRSDVEIIEGLLKLAWWDVNDTLPEKSPSS